MALDPRIPLAIDTSQIYNPNKAALEQQTLSMNNQKLQQAKLERASKYLAMATPENWPQIRQQAISEGLGTEQTIPQQFDAQWNAKTMQAFDEHKAQNTPADITSAQWFMGLDPQQKETALQWKRANPLVDLGGGYGVRNPVDNTITPAVGGGKGLDPKDQPINVENKKKAEKAGEITAQAIADLPKVIANAEMALNNIDAMIGSEDGTIPEHPGLENAVGTIKSRLPTIFDSTADFEARLQQALGGAFLEAYETLRGAGQITEVEGAKATAARTRMKTASSPQGFREAAKEYRDIIKGAVERAKAKAKGGNVNLPGASDQGGFDDLPDPSEYSGRTLTDTHTGNKMKSNGTAWVPLPQGGQ